MAHARSEAERLTHGVGGGGRVYAYPAQLAKMKESGTVAEKAWLADAKSKDPMATPTELLGFVTVPRPSSAPAPSIACLPRLHGRGGRAWLVKTKRGMVVHAHTLRSLRRWGEWADVGPDGWQ